MAFRKQRRLMVEPCEAREMLSADGLAVPAVAEISEPSAEVATFASISQLNETVSPIPGDFDADGDADGDDYLIWQVGYSNGEMDGDDYLAWQVGYGNQSETLPAAAVPGDFDADGDADGDDYLVWQVGFGNGEMDGDDWLAWQAGYGKQNETPKAAAVPGDFDSDGDADGDDYLLWQVGFGNGEMDGDDWLAWQVGYGTHSETLPAAAVPGDFDADGDADGDDYLVWQAGYGNEMDGDDYLAWQVGYGMNDKTDGDKLELSEITTKKVNRSEDLSHVTERPAGKRWALATDVVMEQWARRTF